MKRSIFNRLARMLSLLLATGVWVLVVPPANGQQEVSPTWYDPWPAATKDVGQSSRTRAASKQSDRKVGAAASKPVTRKTRRETSVDQRARASRRRSGQ
jgi:hypothetical protein